MGPSVAGHRLLALFVDLGWQGVKCSRCASLSKVEIDDRGGVQVRSCEKIRPPTIVMPSGLRSSAPTPPPSASGRPPSSAAMVVIMIGRKRSRQAW